MEYQKEKKKKLVRQYLSLEEEIGLKQMMNHEEGIM